MLRNTRFFLGIFVLCSTACSNSKKTVLPVRYFDIPGFFETQIHQLEKSNPRLQKKVETNENSATVLKGTANWTKELAVFQALNINKPAFLGKFKVDSFLLGDQLTLAYTALDKKMPVKSARVHFNKSSVDWVEAEKYTKDALFNSHLYVRFTVDSGYLISGNESINGLSKSNYRVSAKFIYPEN